MAKIQTSEYFKNRNEQYMKNLEKDEARLKKRMAEEYEKQSKRLDKEIASYYSKYGEDNVIEYKELLVKLSPEESNRLMKDMESFFDTRPELDHLKPIRESVYKLNREEELKFNIVKQQIEIGEIEVDEIEKHLSKNYVNTYNSTKKDVGLTGTFLTGDEEQVRNLVNTEWINGENFSDRLWKNKEKLIDYMQNDFKTGVIRGDSYQKLGKQLGERFTKRSKSDIQRLVYTEGTFVNNQAMANPFKDMGYKSYYFDAIIDESTSDTCEGLHGMEFDFADMQAGENFPPMHAYCRSSFTVNTESRIDEVKDVADIPEPYDEWDEISLEFDTFESFLSSKAGDLVSANMLDMDGDLHAQAKKIYNKGWYNYSSRNAKPIDIEEAVGIVRERVPSNLRKGWFVNADSDYKPAIEQIIIHDQELRNATYNIAHQHYQEAMNVKVDFKDFLNNEIPVFRGGNFDYIDNDVFISYSFNKDMAQGFADRIKGSGLERKSIKPVDTLGSVLTQAEAEIMVPRDL